MKSFEKKFLNLSNHISEWSKDKSVGVCAIITSKDNRILSIGYNGFPSKCNDSIEKRHLKPVKYLWTEHAERNAIYNAARNGVNISKSTIYLNWFPCADCARAIIQSGITKIVCYPPDINHEKWGEHFIVAKKMFKECKVLIKYINKNS